MKRQMDMAISEHQPQSVPSPDPALFLSVWDELVRDADLAAALDRVHRDFHLIDQSTFFWYDMTSPARRSPANPIEELAELVVRTVRPQKLAGVEYWSNTLGEGENMPIHQDKDEKLFWTKKQLAHPAISTVYYPGVTDFAGGELTVNRENILRPRANQLVAFRGSLPHGVNKVASGERRSIALNLWSRTPTTYLAFLA
jgi:hypothetical protein